MMYQMEMLPFNYVPEHSLQILELPYEGAELSMLVLLPEESADGSDHLLQLEEELTQEKVDEWTNRDTTSGILVVSLECSESWREDDFTADHLPLLPKAQQDQVHPLLWQVLLSSVDETM